MRFLLLLLFCSPTWATCTIDGTTPGALAIFSNLIFLSSAGTITITNDSAGAHTITIPAITSITSQPDNGIGLDAHMTLSPVVVSGPNAGAPFGGSDSSARVLLLENAGTDVISLGVQGTLDAAALAGSYDVVGVVSCI